jgi:hypothetical protein
MFYIFKTPDNRPRVSTYEGENDLTELDLELVGTSDTEPQFTGREFWIDGGWKLLDLTPAYLGERKVAYPPIQDQLDALWHAMDAGVLPIVEDFYTPLKQVKDSHPKTLAPAGPPVYVTDELRAPLTPHP